MAFRPLAELGRDKAWGGRLDLDQLRKATGQRPPFVVRLVARGGERLTVATFQLGL